MPQCCHSSCHEESGAHRRMCWWGMETHDPDNGAPISVKSGDVESYQATNYSRVMLCLSVTREWVSEEYEIIIVLPGSVHGAVVGHMPPRLLAQRPEHVVLVGVLGGAGSRRAPAGQRRSSPSPAAVAAPVSGCSLAPSPTAFAA
ncbi:hypothetical protein B296_00026843, partial [Ensete ventricosum]